MITLITLRTLTYRPGRVTGRSRQNTCKTRHSLRQEMWERKIKDWLYFPLPHFLSGPIAIPLLAQLFVPEAMYEVVIDHAGGLHKCVTYSWADELESAPQQVLA
jgi:hypothetical protein